MNIKELNKLDLGTLSVIKEIEPRVSNEKKSRIFLCLCTETGKEGIVSYNNLISGHARSGLKFPPRPITECKNIEQFLKQFKWSKNKNGYLYNCSKFIKEQGFYLQHRAIWTYTYGPLPNGYVIDHVNANRIDNRLENLRLLTNQQNAIRRAKIENSFSEYKHVHRRVNRNIGTDDRVIYSVDIGCNFNNKSKYHLGTFHNELEAAKAADNWWVNQCPDHIKYEHDLPGNVPGRFIPYLNFPEQYP